MGLPNAGKSTLLAASSAARPKIADYPFTTLHPQLGVVRSDESEFVLADIPGLIEGAHEGAGLGDRFLGHVERCGVLIHLVDGTQEDVKTAYKTIRAELKAYSPVLAAKPEIVCLNKCDALSKTEIAAKTKALKVGLAQDTARHLRRGRHRREGPDARGDEGGAEASRSRAQGRATTAMRRGTSRSRGDRLVTSARAQQQAENALLQARRIVVKIGSALLVDDATGNIRRSWLDALADDVAQCRRRGQDVIIVSSGAIAVGRRHLGLAAGRLKLEEKQAAAATGQIRLAHAYQETLARHQITVAQVLLTLGDTEERRRHLNARSTLDTLLRLGTVPVINENDTVATSEIRFGDNDRLAARVAAMISADTLILLSDIDGLYTSDPRKDKEARFVPMVTRADAGDRGHGRRGAAGLQLRRHGDQAGGGAGGAEWRLPHGDRQRHAHESAARHRRQRRLHLVPAPGLAATARKTWIAGSLKPQGALSSGCRAR